ncbi:MAG: hypothetical protein P8I96_08200 [Opitutae bacterium]|nr:hypothetical protein [Opitutae bacterium]
MTGSWPNGKHELANFEDKGDAIEYRAKIEQESGGRGDYQLTRTALSREDLSDAENALALPVGDSLSEIVIHYTKLKQRVREIADFSLDQAMVFFRNHYRAEIEELPVYIARERFLATHRDLEKATVRHYENSTRLLLKPDPNKFVHHFTAKDMDRMLGQFKNLNSFNSYRRGLNVFFNWAVRYHLRMENPCGRLDKPLKQDGRIVILSTDEIKRLLKAAMLLNDGISAASIGILLFAGLRPSELEDLQPEDVREKRIRVTGGKLRRKLKRSVEIPLVLRAWL